MTKKGFVLTASVLMLVNAPAQAAVVLISDPGSFAALGTINKLNVPGDPIDQNAYMLGDTLISAGAGQPLQFLNAGEFGFGVTRNIVINGFDGPIGVGISGNYQLVSFLFGRLNPGTVNQSIAVTTNVGTYNFVVPMGSIFSGGTFSFAGFATSGTERILNVSFASGQSVGISEIGLGNLAAVGAIPEPTVWAMMILGFGLVGGALRQRQARQRVTVRFG